MGDGELDRLVAGLAQVDLAQPALDPAAVEEALGRHLSLLAVRRRRVRFIDGLPPQGTAPTYGRDAADWIRARSRARKRSSRAAQAPTAGSGDRTLLDWVSARWPGDASRAFGHADVWDRIAAAVEPARPRPLDPLRLEARPIAPNLAWTWFVEAAFWNLAADGTEDRDAIAWVNACRALADAYLAGLGLFWVEQGEILCVGRPVIRMDANGVLHCGDGPAVRWREGEAFWYWHGVRVPQSAVEEPDAITVAQLHEEPNTEVRRVLLERMGYERYVRAVGGTVVSEDAYGRLWRCAPVPGESPSLPHGAPDMDSSPMRGAARFVLSTSGMAGQLVAEPLFLVEVANTTLEPDGSRRRYFLRVPPSMQTAHEAVAWTFGLDADSYRPQTQS